MGRPERLSEKSSGRNFRPVILQDDPDIDPARIGVYAGDLPSAAKDHTPRTDDYPRGWTVQQPWFHPEFPPPAVMRCIRCGGGHKPGVCEVTAALVALGAVSRP